MRALLIAVVCMLSAATVFAAGTWGPTGNNPVKSNYHPDGTSITASSTGSLTVPASAKFSSYTTIANHRFANISTLLGHSVR